MNAFVITGSWEDITLVCSHRHETPVPMVIQEGPSSQFYACPKYHEQNREEGEKACNNHISLQDYTKMLEHLHQKIMEAEMQDEKINLKNHIWKDRKGIEYKVLEQDGNHLTVQVQNWRAIRS